MIYPLFCVDIWFVPQFYKQPPRPWGQLTVIN